jgi:hypothetical protein
MKVPKKFEIIEEDVCMVHGKENKETRKAPFLKAEKQIRKQQKLW